MVVVAVDCPNIELVPEAAAEGWPKMEPEARGAASAGCPNTEAVVAAAWPKRDPELAGMLVLPKTELVVLGAAPKIPPAALIGELAGAPKMLAEDAGACPNTLGWPNTLDVDPPPNTLLAPEAGVAGDPPNIELEPPVAPNTELPPADPPPPKTPPAPPEGLNIEDVPALPPNTELVA